MPIRGPWLLSFCCIALALVGLLLVPILSEPPLRGSAPPDGAPAKKPARVDLYGDPLPDGAFVRLGTLRMHHPLNPSCVAFSPDGKILASGGGGWGSDVCLWDTGSGKLLRRLSGHLGIVHSVAFTTDGQQLASAGGGTVRLWDVRTGKELRVFGDTPEMRPGPMALSPDGKVVAAADTSARTVHLWEAATGRELHRLRASWKYGITLAFSPDGQALAAGADDGVVQLWDTTTGKKVHMLRGHAHGVYLVAFSPGGKTLVSLDSHGGVRVWDTATGKTVCRFDVPRPLLSAAFARDAGILVTSGPDWTVRAWGPATGKELHRLEAGVPGNLALSADGKTLAVGTWLRDLASGEELPWSGGHRGSLLSIAFSPDGKALASAGDDWTLRHWEAATGKELGRLEGTVPWPVRDLAFTPDGNALVLGSLRGTVWRWDVATRKTILRFQANAPGQALYACVLSPDGRTLATGGTDRTVRLWDAATGKALKELRGHSGDIQSLAFSADGRVLAAGCWPGAQKAPATAHVWDVKTGKEVSRLDGHRGVIACLALSPDGRVLAAAGNREHAISLWEVATRQRRCLLQGHEFTVIGVAFSDDGRLLATGSADETLRLWDVGIGVELWAATADEHSVAAVAFAPGGRMLASADKSGLGLLWDVPNLVGRKRRPPASASPRELDALWEDLASPDAARAHRAVWGLVNRPGQAIPLLQARLRPVPGDQGQESRIARWVADLDSDRFAARKRAAEELEALKERAAPALRKALAETRSPEVRRQAQALLDRLGGPVRSARLLRVLRSVEVLELIATEAAERVLGELADGAPGAPETTEATAARSRLRKRSRSN